MRFRLWFGIAVAIAAAGIAVLACNGILGIDSATNFAALDNCTDYCGDMALICPSGTANQEYLSESVCQKLCGAHVGSVDEEQQGNPVDVTSTITASGDTMACRIWHAHAALEDPAFHCPHAGPLGGMMCGSDPCADFCQYAYKFCGNASYKTQKDCVQACEPDAGYRGFPYYVGDASDLGVSGGNDLNCRMYHLENYLYTGVIDHCFHIRNPSVDPTGGNGPCVDTD